MPSQNEINVSMQRNRTLYTKINLLNFSFQLVDQLIGVVIGNPSFSNDSTSDVRRTCSISLYPTDSSFDISVGNKIWLDKYLQIYIGIKDVHSGDIVYTNMGIYLINNPDHAYSSVDNTLKIQGLDLMAKLTGLRNGNLEGMTYEIPQGSNVRTSMIALLVEAGFTNYLVEECPYTVPNDIKISAGSTVYDALAQLRDIVPNYQIYFDVDGIFHYALMPSGYNEQIMVDDTIWKQTLVSYEVNTDFESLKNYIEVYGKTHDIDNYGSATLSDFTYSATISTVTSLTDQLKIGFTATQYTSNPYLNLNSYGAKPIYTESGEFPYMSYDLGYPSATKYPSSHLFPYQKSKYDTLDQGNYFVVRYIADGDYFMYLGHVTPSAIAEETNPSSPFYIDGTIGKIRIVLSGDDYDNIYSDALAQERANWELYTRCRLLDSVSLVCVPMYWLDVNWLISITLPNKQGSETTKLYLIKQIETEYGSNATQKITLMTYYPYYST